MSHYKYKPIQTYRRARFILYAAIGDFDKKEQKYVCRIKFNGIVGLPSYRIFLLHYKDF
jgi:hypothetical protein